MNMTLYEDVSVIIPAFNEELAIDSTLAELADNEHICRMEVIVVDDGSTDDTARIAEKHEWIRVLKHNKNRGYGSAIVTGSRAAKNDIIVWYDADGQHRPSDLVKVIDHLDDNQYDYCIGERDRTSHVDKSRIVGKWLLKQFMRIVSKGSDIDFNSGLRAFRKSVLEKYYALLPERFGASTVTTLLMQERNYYGGTIPISVRERVGTSSVSQIRDGFRTIGLIVDVVILFRPMKVFASIGFILLLIGSIYGITEALISGLGVPTLAAVSIILGIQILLFGVTISQTSKSRKENLERR